ncbi:MAG: FMN-binding protein [Steroidobacteraceae bacterium]
MERGTGSWLGLALVGGALAPAPPVIAADYLTADAAQRALFPEADAFTPVALALDAAARQRVLAAAGPQPRHGTLAVWAARRGGELVGHVFVDEVLGRVDLITYAAGIDTAGRLRTPEILSYRESHGGEIRAGGWRRQFAGRAGLEALRPGRDIRNIAGATLSCEHVTQGIRWLMALWQAALGPASAASGPP